MAQLGVAETMNQYFKHYYSLRDDIENKNGYRIANMSNAQWQNEYRALEYLQSGLRNAKDYLENKVRPKNEHELELLNLYVKYAEEGLGVQSGDTAQLIAAIDAAIPEIDNVKEQVMSVRSSYFKYDDDTYEGDEKNAIRDKAAARRYLSGYVTAYKNGTLGDILSDLLYNPQKGDEAMAQYNQMVRCAFLLRGRVNKRGNIKDYNDGGAWGDDINKVADYILNYNYENNNAFTEATFGTRTRSGDERGLGRRVDRYGRDAGAYINTLSHLPEGADYKSSGMSPENMASLALRLDSQIYYNLQVLKGRAGSARSLENAVNQLDSETLAEMFAQFLGYDMESANEKAQQIIDYKQRARQLAGIVKTLPPEKYMDFLDVYLAVSDRDASPPAWEDEDAVMACADNVITAKGNKSIGDDTQSMVGQWIGNFTSYGSEAWGNIIRNNNAARNRQAQGGQ